MKVRILNAALLLVACTLSATITSADIETKGAKDPTSGKEEGKWVHYRDGKLKCILHYSKGIPNGAYISFDDNGKIMLCGFQENERMVGNWYSFSEDEKTIEVFRFRDPVDHDKSSLRKMQGAELLPLFAQQQLDEIPK